MPPEHSRIPALISDLTTFARRTDIDPLVKALLAHAQFETIHPFPDGNGRTGRALIHSMLRHDNLTRTVTVPVSAGLLCETDRYFQSLTDYRAGDPSSIVELGAYATLRAVTNGRQLAQDFRVGFRHSQQGLGRARGRAPPLLPFLQSADRDTQEGSKLRLRHADRIARRRNRRNRNPSDARRFSGFHFPHGRQQLFAEFPTGHHGFTHFR